MSTMPVIFIGHGSPMNAIEDNEYSKSNHLNIINYQSFGDNARLSVPIPDHFYPILYILGATNKEDKVSIFNKKCMMGSLSMTSYLFE